MSTANPSPAASHAPVAKGSRAGRITALSLLAGLPIAVSVSLGIAYYAYGALPPVPVPPENQITEAKRVLGKILFWDEQLSTSNTVGCGTCHSPNRAGADPRIARNPGIDGILNTPDDIQGSPGIVASDASNDYQRDATFGINPQITGRSANSPINAAYATRLFWDGRATSRFTDPQTGTVAIQTGGALESQAVQPITNNVEMAHADFDWPAVAAKLQRVNPLDLSTAVPADVATVLSSRPDYPELFRQAFGSTTINARRIAFAIATYQRTLISDQTPWDRFDAGQANALTPAQVRGLQAFNGNARCSVCHTAPLFTGNGFRNIGLRPVAEDIGFQAVTGDINDRGKFKVPSLRNVSLKRTFMHNGQFTTLQQVLGFYARAPGAPIQFPDNRDPVMPTIQLPPNVAADIQDFLTNGLLDPRVANQTFPFDRPTLFTQRPGNQNANLGGGVAGSGGVVPRIILDAPAMVGNLDFRVGLDGALGNAQAQLGISTVAPVNGRITPQEFIATLAVDSFGPGNGMATAHWPLTANVATAGQTLFFQWFVTDASAVDGVARSSVGRVTFFCGSYGCPSPCPADFNNDGGVDGQDVESFFTAWENGGSQADVNRDGGVDGSDIEAFFTSWQGGCA